MDTILKVFKKEQRYLQKQITSYNNKIYSYNNYIREFRRVEKEIETLSRNFKKVQGVTIGITEITLKTLYENGEKVKKRSINRSMKKIEIYGFDNLDDLKVILAHEIGHLVGIPHINVKGALMNPILQKNQKNDFYLLPEDIKNFIDNF